MKVHPEAELISLENCHVGQLVRDVDISPVDDIGVVFEVNDGARTLRGIVYLNNEAATFKVHDDDWLVLAYTGEAHWEIDPKKYLSDDMDISLDRSGLMFRDKQHWRLNVDLIDRFANVRVHKMQLALGTSVLLPPERTRRVGFRSWRLLLRDVSDPAQDPIEMVNFHVDVVSPT